MEESVKTVENKENGESGEDAIHWRINFRHRNRVPCDHIAVESTTPLDEIKPIVPNSEDHTTAENFQFRHELKDSTYKNKYILQIDSHKMKFSERDDSILIRSADDATVLMGTSSNNLFRNRNMAMEEMRKMLKLNLRVAKSLFVSNRVEQMGEMELTEYANSITATNLTVMMDSYFNVDQIIKLHQAPLSKLTLVCNDTFGNIAELEQVRTSKNLKLVGLSKITDKQLLTLEAVNFEISSDKITSKGLNDFIKHKLSQNIPDEFFACVECNKGNWEPRDVLDGFNHTKYNDEAAFVKKNGSLPVNVFEGTLVSIPIGESEERLVVVIQKYYFECFKESKKPRLLTHDANELD